MDSSMPYSPTRFVAVGQFPPQEQDPDNCLFVAGDDLFFLPNFDRLYNEAGVDISGELTEQRWKQVAAQLAPSPLLREEHPAIKLLQEKIKLGIDVTEKAIVELRNQFEQSLEYLENHVALLSRRKHDLEQALRPAPVEDDDHTPCEPLLPIDIKPCRSVGL